MMLNKLIDHTLLKPAASSQDIIGLCKEAIDYDFYSVCVNGSFVKTAYHELQDTDIKVCAVVGFPLGAMSTEVKVFEAKNAIHDGADEIDMVLHIGALKAGDKDYVLNDIQKVKAAVGNKVLKVILETCELTNDQIITACELCIEADADFVKTSTGFSSGGATVEAVRLMKSTVGNHAKVKASGGIRDYETAMKFVHLGVERLGVSSGIAIMKGKRSEENY
ncbi:MAG: deoxyribose-phosphate aldolase [Bacteroidia bacterium]|nr:deoxyribose-phosphate aldolase [Bacteroidia bacterium]MBT8286700.1 deoxyribose-phosphate aldolase [Bacteroidia bacterium]NNK71832.1 deoxyribose-phosphate aldolase [Flavobacteriaceae bacterium]